MIPATPRSAEAPSVWPASADELWSRHATTFRRTIDDPDRHEASTGWLAWHLCEIMKGLGLFTPEEALERRIPQIVSFTHACAPRRGSAAGLREASEFLICFFVLNDFWPDDTPHSSSLVLPYRDARHRFVGEFVRGVRHRYPGRADVFLRAFETYAKSLDHERALRTRSKPVTLEEYRDRHRGRFQWVGTPPYIDLWEMTDVPAIDPSWRPVVEPLRTLSVEMTYIANDMGSFVRDSGGANIVGLLTPEGRDPAVEGFRAAAESYQALCDEYLERAQRLREAPAPIRAYADMVAGVTDGNRDMTALLTRIGAASRYSSEMSEAVARLPALGFPCS